MPEERCALQSQSFLPPSQYYLENPPRVSTDDTFLTEGTIKVGPSIKMTQWPVSRKMKISVNNSLFIGSV